METIKESKCYERYPLWIVLLANLVSLAIYAIGAFVMYQIGPVWMGIYILYIILLEIRLLRKSCVRCYYYDKRCAFGKGKFSSLFFKKGNAAEFNKQHISWKDILPDFFVSVVPLVTGIVLLVMNFQWWILLLLAVLVVLTFTGNGFIRGSLACRYCKQREVGCPAERLFSQGKSSKAR